MYSEDVKNEAIRQFKKGENFRAISKLLGVSADTVRAWIVAAGLHTPRKIPTRGFASMDRGARREIAGRGGAAANAKGVTHHFTTEQAIAAGRLGGLVIGRDRDHMSTIGRRGARTTSEKVKRMKKGARDGPPTDCT